MKHRVSLIRADGYERESIRQSVARAVSLLQSLDTMVKPGMRVLLKPNLLSPHHPDKAITTHPEVIRAVVEIVRDCGAVPLIGDSPCSRRKSVDFLWKVTGVEDVCRETGAAAVNFESAGTVKVRDGKPPLLATRILEEVDLVISLPKFKTHTLTVMTCAIKNLFGVVPGYLKTYMHKVNPSARQLSSVFVDILEFVRPSLVVVDAVLGMEGDGPGPSGTPRHVGLVIAGTNSVAVDAVSCHLMGIEPHAIHMIGAAHERGLGSCEMRDIEIVGERLSDVTPQGFRLPRSAITRMVPEMFSNIARRFVLLKGLPGLASRAIQPLLWMRPRLTDECLGCGECAANCPAKAISIADGKAILNQDKCIECMCCIEICPQKAIELDGSFLARRFL